MTSQIEFCDYDVIQYLSRCVTRAKKKLIVNFDKKIPTNIKIKKKL